MTTRILKHTHAPRVTLSRLASVSVLTLMLSACIGQDSPDALLAKASRALEQSDRKAAEIHLKNLLQNAPEHVQGRQLLARMYILARNERAAIDEWRRALKAGADPEQVVPELLASLSATGQNDAMLEVIQKYPLSSDKGQAAVRYWQGRMAWSQQKADVAAARFQEALGLDAEHHPSRLALIRMKILRDLNGALDDLDALLPKLKKPADALQLKAEIMLSKGDRPGAMDLLDQAVKAEPQHIPSLTQLIFLLVEDARLEDAEKRFSQLQSFASNDLNTRLMRALIDFRSNRIESAATNNNLVLKVAPGYPPALSLGAQIALAQGEYERAEQLARSLNEAEPNSFQGTLLRAAIALARNEPDQVRQLTQPLIDRGARHAGLFAIAGEAALRSNRTAEAIQLLSRSAELDPKNFKARVTLGVAALAGGNEKQGYEELQRAIAIDPSSTRADLVLIGEKLRRSDWAGAMKAIEHYEKRHPEQALPVNLRGTVQLAQGNTQAAKASFEEAAKKDARFFPPVANLVRIDLTESQPARARSRLEEFARKNPKDVNATLALITLLRSQNVPGETLLTQLRQAYQDNPSSSDLLITLAAELTAQNKTKDAIPLVQQAVAQQPEDIRLLELLGNLYLNNKDQQQAIDTFTRIVRIKPDLAIAHLRLAQVKSELGDHAGAVSSFKKAGELESAGLGSQFGMARALHLEGRGEEALKIAREMQKNQPRSAAGLILEGDLLAGEKKWMEAVAVYRRAQGVERSAVAAIREHRALLSVGDAYLAATALEKSVNANPGDRLLRVYAANRAIELGRWKDAVDHYTVGLANSQNDGVSQNNLAWALFQLKELERAEKHALLAVQLLPLSGEVSDTLGSILLASGKTEQAIRVLQHAATLSPKNAEIRLRLVKALQTGGLKEEALVQRDRWLKDFPDSPLRKQIDRNSDANPRG
jgi:putative PEP-CTERM system TPR-repeat lipoprotein